MTAEQFKNKWSHLFTALSLFILDGNENLKAKQATLRLLGSIIGNDDSLSSEVFIRFDGFCQKILKGVTTFDVIKKLIEHDRRFEAFQKAFLSHYSDRLEHVTYVLKSYSDKKDYDAYLCINLDDLETLDFPSNEERQEFLNQLINAYVEYGYLRNAVALSEYFFKRSFTEIELQEFRKRCYFGISYPDAYRFAGMLILEIRFGKQLRNRHKTQLYKRA